MNLQSLVYFIKLTDTLNFTKAAEQLNISQPSLSRHMAELEDELGIRLLDRSNRTLGLTHFGIVFRQKASEIIHSTNQLIDMAKSKSTDFYPDITIGYMGYLDTALLNTVIKNLAISYPSLTINLVQDNFSNLYTRLTNGELDAIISITGCTPSFTGLTYHPLSHNPLCLLVPIAHPLAQKQEPISLSILANEQFVLINREASRVTFDYQISICIQAGFSPKTSCYCEDSHEMQCVISNGKGIGFIFKEASIFYPEDLKVLEIADETPYFQTYLAYPKDSTNSSLQLFEYEFEKVLSSPSSNS